MTVSSLNQNGRASLGVAQRLPSPRTSLSGCSMINAAVERLIPVVNASQRPNFAARLKICRPLVASPDTGHA